MPPVSTPRFSGDIQSSVVQPSDRYQIGLEEVTAFLREGRWRVGSTISPIVHGEWSPAFSFAVDSDAEYVVRFSALDEDFRKDQLATRYATAALPIPRILELGQAFNGFYAISEPARGTFIDALDHHQLHRALPSLWAAIDGMRQSDVSASAGFALWDASGRAPHASWRDALWAIGTNTTGSRIVGWRPRLEQLPRGAEPFDIAFDRLVMLTVDLPNARYLVHADLLNYNVLIEGQRVAAVLDWGAAMYGDWVFDVAWFVFWQPCTRPGQGSTSRPNRCATSPTLASTSRISRLECAAAKLRCAGGGER